MKLAIITNLSSNQTAPIQNTEKRYGMNQDSQSKIEIITNKIKEHQLQSDQSFIEIGKLLAEAQVELKKNKRWLKWLDENFNYSSRTAQRYIRAATEFSDTTLVSDLGYTNALELLGIPSDEREKFIAESHKVNGVDKRVIEMSKRELQQAIKNHKVKSDPSKPETNEIASDKPKVEYTNTKFHSIFQYLEACVNGMVAFIEKQNDDDEASTRLRQLCESTLEKLKFEN